MRDGAIATLILLAMLGGCGSGDASSGPGADLPKLSIRLDPPANAADDLAAQDGDGEAVGNGTAIPGRRFSAITWLPCAGADGRPVRNCPAGVVRKPGGGADVTVIWPDSRTRTVFFDASGIVLGADVNRADGSSDYLVRGVRKEPDITVVTIGPERYEIPDAFVRGPG
ncbi:hypothetical protein [Flavisphingomonas formosensis]|uniref:hypothetical protein n=1 Tax=Flavisphingomonas formosensis TaxID=861534 RepID=UPI0012F8E73D|nr:hypothetical protein [Sphingomonas formosensis]